MNLWSARSPNDAMDKTCPANRTIDTRWTSVLCLYLLLAGCTSGAQVTRPSHQPAVDIQGHRGARGHLPENTIPSFLKAVDLGADTVELDVVVSADGQAVVSHEPWFSAEICSMPDGKAIAEAQEHELNIYAMSYDEISRYDCGLRGNARFPSQQPMSVVKPLLTAAVAAIERHVSETGRTPVAYNVEIKSKPEGDNTYHPGPEEFARRVYDVFADANLLDRLTIQSFDPRALESVHRIDRDVSLALLVDNDLGFRKNLERLTFRPAIYSPNHRLVDRNLVRDAHEMGLAIIPWTVNEEMRMKELLEIGVDGLITDYPDRGRRAVDASQ